MGYLIDGYKIMGQEAKAYVVKHRSGIGTVVSVGGTILSNILSTKAGAKSAREIDAEALKIGRPLTTKEKVKLVWTNHIGSVATAGISCIGAGYSHNQHVKDFNKVATAYAGVKKLYEASRQATKEVLGEKKDIEIQDKMNQKYLEEHPEVKQKLVETVNPNPGVLRKFWEPKSGEVILSTPDKMKLAFKVMNTEMRALKPRNPKSAVLCGAYGIRLTRLFELVDHELPRTKRESDDLKYAGFIKGIEENGSDDDNIDAYFSPMLLDDETMETGLAINWMTSPSDLRYGDYLKS